MVDMTVSHAVEDRLAQLGLVLPQVPAPIGQFCLGRLENGFLFLSGQGPVMEDGRLATGKVGLDVTAEAARDQAARSGLVLLAAARLLLGSLDRVAGVVKLLGYVNAVPEFDRHPFVIDGCSDLMREIFGKAGEHARSAIGVASLPGRITVEIEAVFRVEQFQQ